MDAPKHTFETMARREDMYQIGEDEGRTRNKIAEMAPVKAKDNKSFFLWCTV